MEAQEQKIVVSVACDEMGKGKREWSELLSTSPTLTRMLLQLEMQPWKCSGLESQRNMTDTHVFNMHDFDELQEMFDVILVILDDKW